MTAVVCVSSGENSHLMLHMANHWNEWHLILLQLEILTESIDMNSNGERWREKMQREKMWHEIKH